MDAGTPLPASKQSQTEVVPNFQNVVMPSQSLEAQIVYDHQNKKVFKIVESGEASQALNENVNVAQNLVIVQETHSDEEFKAKVEDISSLLKGSENPADQVNDHLSDQSEQQRALYGQRFSDNLSILRFVKGNKSKGLELSSSGLTLKLNKSKSQKSTDEELVLTNMAFYSGLHLWEIIAPISCNNISVGVYNPVTKQEVMSSFKTTTPRVITICLDLNENQLKFWLNDRRNTNKNLKLAPGGPWIPCVKLSVERNKLILNPYAKEPSDFYEKDFDKKFTLKKYLMPHLHNMLCVTKLPQLTSQSKASQQLKEHLKISSSNINTILMPHYFSDSSLESSPTTSASDCFCFIQFHYHDNMAEFIQKNKSSQFQIYQPYQIAEWFEQSEIADEIKEPFKVISEHIFIPKTTQGEAISAISNSFETLVNKKEFKNSATQSQCQLILTQQPFTDKLICIKDQQYFKTISRANNTLEFDINDAHFNEPPTGLDQAISLKLYEKNFETFFQTINWSSIFKENNDLINGLVKYFFTALNHNAQAHNGIIFFRVPLNTAKFTIDVVIQHMRSQLDRVKRQFQNYQTVIPADSLINKNKPEVALDSLKGANFYRDPNLSVDELYLILNILYDIQEQIWAQTRSAKCPPEVKHFVNSVSRTYSAFNRLGSFVSWGLSDVHPKQLADEGFIYKENGTVNHFENPGNEIAELSQKTLLDENLLSEVLGKNSRHLRSLVSENVPLYKTLNYFAPQRIGGMLDIISSQNNDFVLVGLNNGSLFICNSSLQLTNLKTVSMFSNDQTKKLKKHKQILDKILSRISAFEEYKKSSLRKSIPLSIFKNLKSVKQIDAPKSQPSAISKTSTSKILNEITKIKQNLKQKKILKTKKKKNQGQQTPNPIDEMELAKIKESFSEVIVYNTNTEDIQNVVTLQNANQCKVLGYFLLSKPAYEKSTIDPVTVGCIFYSSKTQKFYVRARKLMITLQYLHIFISLDPISGQQINKLSGKQILDSDDFYSLYEEILNHKENIVDLYSIFMRTQVIKKDWPKKDYKFSILCDLSESELEIENCKRIIDFTRCSYSITNQNRVHIVYEDQESKSRLTQFNLIDGEFKADTQICKVSIQKGLEKELEQPPLRIFQVESKVILVGKDKYQVLDQQTFDIEVQENLKSELNNGKTVTILNQTPASKVFNQQNLSKYSDASKVPKQDWKLVISKNSTTQADESYAITSSDSENAQYQSVKKQKTERVQDIDLTTCIPSDIVQIGNLLEAQIEGVIASQNSNSVLTSSGIAPDSQANLHHNWQIIKQSKEHSFKFRLPEDKASQSHLKQIDLEFSLKRKVVQPIEFKFQSKNEEIGNALDSTIESSNVNQEIKRLPLVVDHLVGAQINDIIQPNYLTSPDAPVFSSNYPQPEFIFKLQSNKAFVPSQFIVRSKENRDYNGIPISQGLIFVSESFEDLLHTKQFSKFTLKEYTKWKEQRDQVNLPLLPNEPVAFFDLEDKTEIIIQCVHSKNPVRFIKFIPTAFRKRPINFSSKPFHSNQAEIQFFGVNGYEVQNRVAIGNEIQNLNEDLSSLIQIQLDVALQDKHLGQIGELDKVRITEIRNPKSQYASIPLTSLAHLQVPSIIGVARASIPIKEDHSDSISELEVHLKQEISDEWEIQGVSVCVQSYTDSSAIFASDLLTENKPKLRHYLLDITLFPKLLQQLLNIAQDQSQSNAMREASIQCILNYLKNNSYDKNQGEVLRLFKEHTIINQILSDNYLDQSLKYQTLAQTYLDKVGLLKQNSDFIAQTFLKSQISKLLSHARPIEKVRTVLDLVALCPDQQRIQYQKSLVEIFVSQVCNQFLPQYQTPEYILLRSKLNINKYPFDQVFQSDQTSQKQEAQTLNQSYKDVNVHHLECDMEVQKLNTLYSYALDLNQDSFVDALKLYFEADPKNLYKISVKVIVPDANGAEKIYFSRIYDENYYTQLCEKAEKPDVVKYFQTSPSQLKNDNQTNSNTILEKSSLDLNCLTIDLHGYIGRYLKVQIDLLDSYKTVHKQISPTNIFIAPVLLGYNLGNKQANDESKQALYKRFLVKKGEQSHLLGSLTYVGQLKFTFYLIPSSYLSSANKACLISVSKQSLSKDQQENTRQSNQENEKETNESKPLDEAQKSKQLKDLTEELKISLSSKGQQLSKKALKKKIAEIDSLMPQTNEASSTALTLRYLLELGDLLSSFILQALKTTPNLLDSYDTRDLYVTLFKHFTMNDIQRLHPNVQKLLSHLFVSITDKSTFVCKIYKDFLLNKDSNINQKNVIEFIQKQDNVDFNSLINEFSKVFKLENELVVQSQTIDSESAVQSIVNILQLRRESDLVPLNSILSFLTIIDDLKLNQKQENLQNLRVEKLFQLVAALISKNAEIMDHTNQNGSIGFRYAIQVLSKYSNITKQDDLMAECQTSVLQIILLGLQANDKSTEKSLKLLLQDLQKHDTSGHLSNVLNNLLSWYKNKKNMDQSHYYQSFEEKSKGQATGIYFKHLSQVFKLLVKSLQSQKKAQDDRQIENMYKDLSLLLNDLLLVLINDQDQPNYEDSFSIVWIQIYKTIGYLTQHNLQNEEMIDLLAKQFYNLRPLHQEIMYPKFHHINEKLLVQQKTKDKDPQMMISLLKAFLLRGFSEQKSIKIAYCFCDGLLNMIQTQAKDKSSQSSITCKFTPQQLHEFTDLLANFLNQYANHGVFTGVTGAHHETIMQLDIALQMASIVNNSTTKDDQNAFEDFIKSDFDINKKNQIITGLIDWVIINYFGQKSKSTPAGLRIYNLTMQIVQILEKVSASESTVTEALPILMKSVLNTDYKLRDLILSTSINYERAISIQKTVNTLFLQFFKFWVKTDTVAKKFLTELNGFDFLLDRLFTKGNDEFLESNLDRKAEDDQQDSNKDKDGLLLQDEDDEDQELEIEDQIMLMIAQKLFDKNSKQGTAKQKAELQKLKSTKAPLPIMKKETAVLSDAQKAPACETQLKEVEQKLLIDDYGKNLKIIWSSDKKAAVASTYGSTQWHKFKNSNKNRLYNYQIGDQAHQYEYVMKFDLQGVIQISEIQVGILYNWSTFDPDCQYEPLSFILEGGLNDETPDWRVLMEPVQDEGFKMNSITVFGHNFMDNQSDQKKSLEKVLESIGCKESKYLTMRFRKPVMSCLDQSPYVACTSKAKAYGITYISVMGTQQVKNNSVYQYLIDIQKENSLEVLSKFFSSEFTEAFEIISEQEYIIDKIKNAFDKLASLFNTKASLIKPIFLAICSKNKELGDWIMMNRLISLDPSFIKKEQISFLGDIISSNREKQLDKLFKLKDFVISQINSVADGKISLSSDQQTLLGRYLKLYSNKLREYCSFINQQQGEVQKIELEFKTEDLDNIIGLMSQCKAGESKFFNALTSFGLMFLSPPSPLVNKTIDVLGYVEKLISSKSNQIQNLLFSSIISTTNLEVISSIIANNKVDWVLQNLKTADSLSSTDVYQYAQILFNCSKQQSFREKYRDLLTFELYSILKQSDEKATKILRENVPQETVELLVQTIRDIVLGGDADCEKLSGILKQDMIQASEKGDVEFINKVIVPILHAEEKVPITINLVDLSKKDKRFEPIFAGSQNKAIQDNFFLKTDILNKKQKDTFTKNFKDIAGDKMTNYQKMMESKWELVFEDRAHQNQSPARFKKFVQSISNKSNVIILVSCKIVDQPVVFGGFTNQSFPALGESWAHEFDYQVPFSEANFVCHYTPEKELHFTMTHNKPFGYIYTDYEEGGALSISGDFFLISWSYEFQNSCGNIFDMKCVEEPSVMSFYNNMEIQAIEVWWCDLGTKSTMTEGKVKSDLKKNPCYKPFSPFNFFRENLIFEVSKSTTLSHIAKEILGKHQVFTKYPDEGQFVGQTKVGELFTQLKPKDSILDLIISKDRQPEESKKQDEVELPSVVHETPILKKFVEKGGIFDLIKAAKAAVKIYRNEKLSEMWTLWLNEIESFSQLPNFFTTFCQDHSKEAIIYNLLEGKYDTQIGEPTSPENLRIISQQEELHIEMVKYSYKIVNQVFVEYKGADLRDLCFKNGTFERFIERIGQLSSEKKRVKVAKNNSQTSEAVSMTQSEASSPEKTKESNEIKQKKKSTAEKKEQKRKGVGYTTGVGTTWNVSEYLKSREAKSSQAANIVNILKHIIGSKDWEAPPEIKSLLLESAILPTLESALRSGSLLEIAKEYELNMAYLGFIQELAQHENLIDLLLDIGDEYQPRQKEPIYQLLLKLNDLSSIFLKCLESDTKATTAIEDDQKKPKELSLAIQETNKVVQEKIQQSHQIKQQQSLQEILSMPLSEAYHKLLSPLRFEYMNIKGAGGTYNHAYVGELSKGLNPPPAKLVRLAQEIADLSTSLPCDYTNAIFCRVDQERVDVMKCLIMGASGTPYAHGAFIYDLFFENNYPNGPPKCQLVTTGNQTVRFNPNLYNNGKVCLSLLGTWRGQSTENWDPKLSTILQVLLSIQAIIMSNEVYFNEPGYEHEQGTVDGERKNEGYSNIVRYCNIKFAMIEQIKNPPPGFEKVIRRSFYLKKNEILREVKEWVDRAKVSDALYQGLAFDHNYHWAPQISPEGKYAEMMEAIYKELKETLESIPSPFEDEATGQKIERKFSKHEDEELVEIQQKPEEGTVTKIEDIDVSYEPSSASQMQQSININDDKVKDRWSRYIGAMGIEAVAKQAESRILISGLGPLGVEIAKNIVLAGCKELILFDDVISTPDELSGQFFITEQEIKDIEEFSITRATLSKDKLQQLNYYVKVSVLLSEAVADYIRSQKDLKVVVLTDLTQYSPIEVKQINQACRETKTALILAFQNGLFSKVFNDFGPDFHIIDKDGEDLQEVMIQDISYDDQKQVSVVTLLPGFTHKFEDGDQIRFKEVLGMRNLEDQSKSINDISGIIVKRINNKVFSISEDVRLYTKYEGNGIAKEVKVPKKLEFKSIEECDEHERQDNNEPLFDQNLYISDFEKMDNKRFMHWIYKAMHQAMQLDEPSFEFPFTLGTKIASYAKTYAPKDLSEKQLQQLENMALQFALTYKFTFPPMAAFIGGVVSQEIVKAITQKYTPIQQSFYFDCSELYQMPDLLSRTETDESKLIADPSNMDRYQGLNFILGSELFEQIKNCKLFMIGAGAIGCELLKNYAMLGLGTGSKGQIILTDPDVIEVSNLNRQFLFREKHLRKPKSQTAAAAAIQMNPGLKNHISARLDKIHDGTAHIYNEQFFKSQTIVTNALDNVQARLYIDSKCVAARTPLIDSGTLGPKGHVQIVIPFKTESYASQNDPEDNTEIPHCTLKMFPEETLHCVEWAKDLFGNLFTLLPQSFNKLVVQEADKEVNLYDQQEVVALKKAIKVLQKKPETFEDCIRMARERFQKHFYNDIKQLLHVYPIDKTTKEGRPFWSLPKRPPSPIVFDEKNILHASVIAAAASLYAKMFNIKNPYGNPRSADSKLSMATLASTFVPPEFVPNDQKATEIQSKVDKEAIKGSEEAKEEEEQQQMQQSKPDEMEELKRKYEELIKPIKKAKSLQLQVEEFEKDNDENFHIDFIYSMANVRALNYKLEEMEWINVKIKAGKIVPALATTTAAIAGLQTIELIKYLKGCKIEEHRNSFLNLAVPSLMMSEPGAAMKKKLKDDLEVTLWDRWEYEASNKEVTLLEVVKHLEEKYKLSSRDIFYGSIPVFIYALQGKDPSQREQALGKPILEKIHVQSKETLEFIDLTITFVDESKLDENGQEKMIEGVPNVRVTFKK